MPFIPLTSTPSHWLPSLILQPVLEKSVKYAVSRSRSPVQIGIRVHRAGELLVLEVTDSGGPDPAPQPGGTGVGLNNIRARLDVLYGKHADLAAGPAAGGGFAVRIRLPLEIRENQDEHDAEGGHDARTDR